MDNFSTLSTKQAAISDLSRELVNKLSTLSTNQTVKYELSTLFGGNFSTLSTKQAAISDLSTEIVDKFSTFSTN